MVDEAEGSSVAADFCRAVRFSIQGRNDEAQALAHGYLASPKFIDPEGLYHMAQVLSRTGDHDAAMDALRRSADGYCGLPALASDVWLDPLRARPDFRRLLERAEAQRRAALDAFIVAGGERLLGVAIQ